LLDRPVEYLLKLRCELKSGVKYREIWLEAEKLCAEFAVGSALIKQFEASKVGQLAVDAYLSKRRRSLPSSRSFSDKPSHHATSAASGVHKNKSFPSNVKLLKRKNCDLIRQNSLTNSASHVSSEKLKSSSFVTNNNSTANKSSGHKPLSFYGVSTQSVSRHKHFAKRLLLSDKVPCKNWSKNVVSKELKLPNLLQSKPTSRKSDVVSCKYEDSDSDADVRYSLATDHGNASSEWGNTDRDAPEKKRRKLSLVDGITKNENNAPGIKRPKVEADDTKIKFKVNAVDSKRPKFAADDTEIKFQASTSFAGHGNYKAGIAR